MFCNTFGDLKDFFTIKGKKAAPLLGRAWSCLLGQLFPEFDHRSGKYTRRKIKPRLLTSVIRDSVPNTSLFLVWNSFEASKEQVWEIKWPRWVITLLEFVGGCRRGKQLWEIKCGIQGEIFNPHLRCHPRNCRFFTTLDWNSRRRATKGC